MTGNPRCQSPAFLREIPLQDVAAPDFRCEDGTQTHTHACRHAFARTQQQGACFRSTDLCPAPRRPSGRGELRPGPAVSQSMHVHGFSGSLQQQTPPGSAQGSAQERHRAVSLGVRDPLPVSMSHDSRAFISRSKMFHPGTIFESPLLDVLIIKCYLKGKFVVFVWTHQVSGWEPVHQCPKGVGNLQVPAAGVRILLP